MSTASQLKIETAGMLPLRAVVGLVFLVHGGQKLFYFGIVGVADMLSKVGFMFPQLFAVLLIAIELAGAVAILFGLSTRTAGVVLALEMVIAIFVARIGGGFFTPYGYEFELTLLGACLTLAAVGAGGISIDAMLRQRRGQSQSPLL
jgi:putative oxidoreductase